MPLRPSEAGRRGLHDCSEGVLRVADVKIIEYANETIAQLKCFQLSGGRQGGAEQHDAEVGIGANGPEGRVNRSPDTSSDARGARTQRIGRGSCALDELRRRHPMAGRKDMNIARLRGFEFISARGDKGFGHDPPRRHALAPRTRRSAIAAMTSPASTAAILNGVTFCRPAHAGILLTSSTVGRPSIS